MAEIASAFVTIVPSARGFGSKLNSEVGGSVRSSGTSLGKTFGKMFAVGAAVIAAAGIGNLLKGSIEEAREAQKVGAQTNAVLKSTGGVANVTAKDIGRLTSALSAKIGVDDEVIQAGENMLLTFTNVRNEVGKGNNIFDQATRTVSDMAAAFGGDAVSNSKILGKALNDPAKGVSALTRVGVTFTEKQKEQIKTLQESGNILGAQKIILKELGKETKGSAEAQATASDKASVAFGNLKEQIGTALLPVVDSLANLFTTKIAPALTGFITNLTNGTGSAGRFGAFLSTNVLPPLQALAGFVITQVIPAFRDALGNVLDGARSAFDSIAKAVARNRPEMEQLANVVKKVATFIYTKLYPALYTALGKALPYVGKAIGLVIDGIAYLVKAFNFLKPYVISAATTVFNSAKKYAQFAKSVIEKVGDVLAFFKALPGKIKGIVSRIPDQLKKLGGQMIDGLVNGLKAAAHKVEDVVQGIIDKIPKKIRKIMGISSPSKVTTELGRFIGDGLAKGIADSADKVGDAVEKVGKKVKEKIAKLRDTLSTLRSDFASLVDPIASAFTGNLFEATTAKDFVASLLGTKGQLTGLIGAFKTLIGQGLNPKFLYDLFQSGNAGLILDLAANPALAAQAGGLFGDVNQLSTQLGQAVAGATPDGVAITSAIDKNTKKLDELIGVTKRVGADVGGEVNGAAGNGHRRGNHGGRRAA